MELTIHDTFLTTRGTLRVPKEVLKSLKAKPGTRFVWHVREDGSLYVRAKTLALEVATDGITVNCISPGYVWTPLVESQIPDTMASRGLTREQVMNDVLLAAQPTKAFVTPEQVAGLALYLCRDEAASITGANLSMDGGWTAA